MILQMSSLSWEYININIVLSCFVGISEVEIGNSLGLSTSHEKSRNKLMFLTVGTGIKSNNQTE